MPKHSQEPRPSEPQGEEDIEITEEDIVTEESGKVIPFPMKKAETEKTGEKPASLEEVQKIYAKLRKAAEEYRIVGLNDMETGETIRKEAEALRAEFVAAVVRLKPEDQKAWTEIKAMQDQLDDGYTNFVINLVANGSASWTPGSGKRYRRPSLPEQEAAVDPEKALSAVMREALELKKEQAVVLTTLNAEESPKPGFFKRLFGGKKERAVEKGRKLFEERMASDDILKAAMDISTRLAELDERRKTLTALLPEEKRKASDELWAAIQ